MTKRITNTAGKPVEKSGGNQVRTQDPGLHLPGSKIDLFDWTDGVSHLRKNEYRLPVYLKGEKKIQAYFG